LPNNQSVKSIQQNENDTKEFNGIIDIKKDSDINDTKYENYVNSNSRIEMIQERIKLIEREMKK